MAMRRKHSLLFFLFFFPLLSFFIAAVPTDTITSSQSIKDGNFLISAGGTFKLGFFPPGSSNNKYLGIFYGKDSMPRTVVWVANRDKPLSDSTGVFKIGDDGNLVLVDQSGTVFWSSGSPKASNPTVKLLDSGNLELRKSEDDDLVNSVLWQSFDHPTDTLLPGMKLGLDTRTRFEWQLTSWKSADDPSPGDYLYRVVPTGLPQSFLLKRSSSPVARSGPWFGLPFSGSPDMMYNNLVAFQFVFNEEEVYYSYQVKDSTTIMRLVVSHSGALKRLVWKETTRNWSEYWYVPKDQCDNYAQCGAFGLCNPESPFCKCLDGFESSSRQGLNLRDGSNRCVRREEFECGNGEGFKKVPKLKLPDTSNATVDMSMSLEQCKEVCLKNCSCVAYAAANYSSGSGCLMWNGDLLDTKEFSTGGQEIYIRLAPSELVSAGDAPGKKQPVAVIVSVTAVAGLILVIIIGFSILRRKKKGGTIKVFNWNENRETEVELPLFEFETIVEATDDFSIKNRIGKGGFGPVYKGKLENGQEIAVKRLSRNSRQGLDQFMNEVTLIAKLQHRNLVRLLGCCVQGEERMLVYEYMPNRSLDSFIFDKERSPMLDWKKRIDIVLGIARGILYLHQDSRLRIIHRDLKASNILLDQEMNPKISDFGTARTFKGDQIKDNTTTVIGTYGYMSPEYVMDGIFSMKSDVFSFGVLILEIMSGKKNRGVYQLEPPLTLLGYAWKLWNEGKCSELPDKAMGLSEPNPKVMRCIHVGLLCVQERASDRPEMSSVVIMLGSEIAALPPPKNPGFPTSTRTMVSSSDVDSPAHVQESCTAGEITLTVMEGR